MSSVKTEPEAHRRETYHLAGIAGVGMSALAELLDGLGCRVQGSDRHADQGASTPALDRLCARGIALFPQDGRGLRPDLAGFVFSTAIEDDNPDLLAAQRMGIPLLHRARLLADLTAGRRCVAVAGTAGKTTVTGLTGWLLEQAGLDPTVVNGGGVLAWQTQASSGSIRVGNGGPWVVEADESDKSCLHFEPDWAVITNLSHDHFDLEETRALFRDFRDRCRQGIVYGPGVKTLLGAGPSRLLEVDLEASAHQAGSGDLTWQGHHYPVPLPGSHNRLNVLSAVALCRALEVPAETLARALPSFQGIDRRLRAVGEVDGVKVWDDYAHNPAKLAAAWRTAAEASRRVLGVWRPHGYGPLKGMLDELVTALAGVMRPDDRLYLLPVYDAGGTANRSIQSDALAERLHRQGRKAEMIADYATLETELREQRQPGDLILVMGARDPDLPVLAQRLAGA